MFLDSLDIANRALQHCGSPQILAVTEDTKSNVEATFAYDKLRRVELRRNTWRFATKRACLRAMDAGTMILQPAQYSAAAQYGPGAIVADVNQYYWVSAAENNFNNAPGGNNEVWNPYFGPLTAEPYSAGSAYWAGELVYVQTPNSPAAYPLYQLYMSLTNNNSDTPNVATPYSATTLYNGGQSVTYSGSQWYSLIELNLGNTPVAPPAPWSSIFSYVPTNQTVGSDHFIYTAILGTVGNDPTTDGGVHWTNTNVLAAWSATPTQTVSDINWAPISATMKSVKLLWPAGSGPSSESETRNLYRLPSNYLKSAPQDPKAGATSFLGAPSGIEYADWEYDSDFIVSSDVGPLLYRFVADVIKVRDMDDMFCEGLSLKIATGIIQSLTQSREKLQDLASEYKVVMSEARAVNAIETGPVEPEEDDFIACRR